MTTPSTPTSSRSVDLAAWRLHLAKLTQREAADRAGIAQRHVNQIESNPRAATVGALKSFVEACGGRLEITVELGGVRRLLVLLAALLFMGCNGETPEAPAGTAEQAVVQITPRLVVAPDLAMVGVAAVELWESATLGAYAPDLTISDDCGDSDVCIQLVGEQPTGCGEGDGEALACFRPTEGRVDVWTSVREAERVSVVAHEIGHSLGLRHGVAGIMQPHRDRTKACIEEADLAALKANTGAVGGRACVW